MSQPRAVVLLSGGMDSATCLAVAIAEGYEVHPIAFRYGQRHAVELECAARVCAHFGLPQDRLRVIDLSGVFRGSALTGDAPVPTGRAFEDMAAEIPATYVPARNIVFLSLAAAHAEPLGARDIFIGVNAIDYSGYPDCRPEFITAFTAALNLGTRAGEERRCFRIHTPLARLTKGQIVRLGQALGVPFHLTHSCYQGTVPACGVCDSCQLRLKGFREAGLEDPIPYRGVK